MSNSIDIVLPAYNGEKFLPAQIDSLLHQTHSDWRLIIRDDISSDGTNDVINRYRDLYPDKIHVLDNQRMKRGVIGSYECLLEACTARYVAFCDQDDVWLPDKLHVQLNEMLRLESCHGSATPILIHTDLSVVDTGMGLLNSSFWEYQHLCPDKMSTLSRLLVQNCVTGCTVLVNRPLLQLALPIPDRAIMHDWWMALVAVSEGVISEINLQTVHYRQHDNNDTGAKKWAMPYIINSIMHQRKAQKLGLLNTRDQAAALLDSDLLSNASRQVVGRYVLMFSRGWIARRFEMLYMGFFKYGLVRNIAMFMRI